MFVIGRVILQGALIYIREMLVTQPARTRLSDMRREEVQPRRHCDGFGAPTNTELAIDTADLGLNRIGGNYQRLRHLSIGLPCNQQTQHPLLLL